jgi:hypothetical protein
VGKVIFLRASTTFSLRYSWVKYKVALAITMAKIMMVSVASPTTSESLVAMRRIINSMSVN